MKHSVTISVRVPYEIAKELDELGNEKNELIKKAIHDLVNKRKDPLEILETNKKEALELINNLDKQIEAEKTKREEYYSKNKAKATNVYMQILKYYSKVFKDTNDFISNQEVLDLIDMYCKLTGEKANIVQDRVKEEVKNGLIP